MSAELRRLALSAQGLLSARPYGKGLRGARKAIEHLGYVQIDTLSVVQRAHHHVLWSRVPDYNLLHLNKLLRKQHIFEYWYHAASYLPIGDYRYALPHMNSVRRGENRYYNNVDKRLMKQILARVRADGALRLRDLDQEKKKSKGDWWNWGPGQRALDRLFMQGDLMVCERNGMEKVYDLSERCLPSDIDLSTPTLHEYAAYLLDTTFRAHGVVTWKQLLHLKTGKPMREAMRAVLDERIETAEVSDLGEINGATVYVLSKLLKKPAVIDDTALKIVSPFDNAVIHRERLNALFAFDYRIECYVPAAKRVYGYFSLPVLFGDRFVARIDCKAHRAQQRFEVLSLNLEDEHLDRDAFFPALYAELQIFAAFNQCLSLDTKVVDKLKRRVARS